MILYALDEVLFWDNIPILKRFIERITLEHYPHDPDGYFLEKDKFLAQHIPDKKTFIAKLENYSKCGLAVWVSGRSQLCDDIDTESMIKAIKTSSRVENGKSKAVQASKWQQTKPDFWGVYSDNVLHNAESNRILELTIGAGGGTNAVMMNMQDNDYYMGVDIDFVCAKNADALAKHYNVNGLGIAASLWNLPFDDETFTSVCSNAGLEECREIPTILTEAVRVLAPKGRITLHCIKREKSPWYSCFSKYGFTESETDYWLKKIRLFSDSEQIKDLLKSKGLYLKEQKDDESLGHIIVFEKQ